MGGTAEVKKWNRDSSSQRQRKLNPTRHKHCQFLSEELLTKSTGRIAIKLLPGNGPYSALFTPTNLAAALPEAVDYTLCAIVLPTIRFPCSTHWMLRPAAWSPFAINLAANLAMIAPNERLPNGKETLSQSSIYSLAENRFQSRLNSIICITGISLLHRYGYPCYRDIMVALLTIAIT